MFNTTNRLGLRVLVLLLAMCARMCRFFQVSFVPISEDPGTLRGGDGNQSLEKDFCPSFVLSWSLCFLGGEHKESVQSPHSSSSWTRMRQSAAMLHTALPGLMAQDDSIILPLRRHSVRVSCYSIVEAVKPE